MGETDPTPQQRRNYYFIILSVISMQITASTIYMVFPLFFSSVGLDKAESGLLISIGTFAGILSSIAAGVLSNKYGRKNILFIGAIRERKGPHLLVNAMTQVIKKHPDAVLIIGGGSTVHTNATGAYAEKIFRAAEQFKGNIRILGFVQPSEVPDTYLLGDVFAAPSIWDEPFGLVAAEASSCGLPVVASKCGGLPEIIKDKETGLIVDDPENIDELAQKIVALLDDRALAEKYGKAGRALMEKEFTWNRVAKENEELFRKLLGNES